MGLVLALVGGAGGRADSAPAGAPAVSARTVVVLGDSLAAGYGVEPKEAFPAVLQDKVTRAGLPFSVINAGVSGDTTAGGLRRLNWLLRRPMEVLIIELGGNDGLRGLDPGSTRSNLVAMIDRARERQPGMRVLLTEMEVPANLGDDYVGRFREVFPAVAREKDVALIPGFLEGVAGLPEMNQADLIHPTAAGHRRLAENVWEILRPVLEAAADAR